MKTGSAHREDEGWDRAVAAIGAEPWFKLKSNTTALAKCSPVGGGW